MRLRKFPVSWDQIIGNHLYNRVTFDMNLLRSANAIESYYEIISRYQQIFDYVKGDNTTEVYTASNLLPFTLYSSFEHMSKFRLCRWIYQNGQMKTPNSLAEMQVDPKIVKAHKKLSESVKQCPKTYFIWDSNIFLSFIKEIKFLSNEVCRVVTTGICTVSLPPKNPAMPFFLRVTVRVVVCFVTVGFRLNKRLSVLFCFREASII